MDRVGREGMVAFNKGDSIMGLEQFFAGTVFNAVIIMVLLFLMASLF